jgi:hypothetical protein
MVSLAHKTPFYNKNASEVVFHKTVFVKFKLIVIANNFRQNIDKTHSKKTKLHRKAHISLWIFKNLQQKFVNKKSHDICQMLVISNKKTIT